MISSALLGNKTAKGVFEACKVLNKIFPELLKGVTEGRSTLHIDQLAQMLCKQHGVEPAFLGLYGFPNAVCICVNNELAHGVPRGDKKFKKGDLVKIDFGVKKDGYYSDCARSIVVGSNKKAERLIKAVKKVFNAGMFVAWPDALSSEIPVNMTLKAEEEGVYIFEGFCGHTIGTQLHDGKSIPNTGPWENMKIFTLKEGDLICIEPIIGFKKTPLGIKDDKFTFLTTEGDLTAHYENTILITKEGPIILTDF